MEEYGNGYWGQSFYKNGEYKPVITLSYGFHSADKKAILNTLKIINTPSAFHLYSMNRKVQYPTLIKRQR